MLSDASGADHFCKHCDKGRNCSKQFGNDTFIYRDFSYFYQDVFKVVCCRFVACGKYECINLFLSIQTSTEFTYEPSEGELKPLETKEICVTFHPQSLKSVKRVIEIIVDEGQNW